MRIALIVFQIALCICMSCTSRNTSQENTRSLNNDEIDRAKSVIKVIDGEIQYEYEVQIIPNAESEFMSQMWVYEGTLHRLLETADMAEVLYGGLLPSGATEDDRIVCKVTRKEELAEWINNLEFQKRSYFGTFPLKGSPYMRFYNSSREIARVYFKSTGVEWSGFPGSIKLTNKSKYWLHQWFLSNAPGLFRKDWEGQVPK